MKEPESKKVRFDFLDHPAGYGGESLWADHLMEDLYEVRNIPVFAYGVNFRDVVRVEKDEDGTRQVKDVVRRSSYHTIRIFFIDGKTSEENFSRLKKFKGEGIGSEKWNDDLYALNVTPERDYEEFIDTLEELAEKKVIEFELSGEWKGNFDGTE